MSDEEEAEDDDEEEVSGLRNRPGQKVRQELQVSVPNTTNGLASGENISPGIISSPHDQDNKGGHRGEGLLQCTTPQTGDQLVRR